MKRLIAMLAASLIFGALGRPQTRSMYQFFSGCSVADSRMQIVLIRRG